MQIPVAAFPSQYSPSFGRFLPKMRLPPRRGRQTGDGPLGAQPLTGNRPRINSPSCLANGCEGSRRPEGIIQPPCPQEDRYLLIAGRVTTPATRSARYPFLSLSPLHPLCSPLAGARSPGSARSSLGSRIIFTHSLIHIP